MVLRLFVFGFFRREQARGGTERLAMIEQREIAHVQSQRTAGTFFVDHHRDGTAFDAFAKANTATTSEARVREPFQHPAAIILQERLDLPIDLLL
jgi:hypothetical protein